MCRTLGSPSRLRSLIVLVALFLIVTACVAAASGLQPFSPRSGPPLGAQNPRTVTWSQPPDLNGYKISSEEFVQDYESEVADDFMMPAGENFTIDFWGGYWDWSQGDPEVTAFNIRAYADAGCVPGALLLTEFAAGFTTTFIGYDGWGWPTYRYHIDNVWLDLQPYQRHWIVFQANDHPVPPYWGRQQAMDQVDCEVMFRSNYFGYYDWTPGTDIVGYPVDTSFELDCHGCSPPRGACCLDDGQCVLSYATSCHGEFMGEWTDCDPDPCPDPPLGACCGPGGSCVLTIEPECLSGDWRDGASCDPSPCPDVPPIGDCLEYGDFPHFVGSVALPGDAEDVALTESRALVAEGADGIHVLDITNPAAPRILGAVNTPGWALGVAISGTTAYVADSTALCVIDLADSLNPRIVGSVSLGAFAHAVAVSGTYAYVVGGPYFLSIDVSNPRNPTLAGQLWLNGSALDVAVAGGLAYVAGQPGLVVIDIAHPTDPTILGSVAAPSPARGLALWGNLACLADMESGLQVVDITDPAHPSIVGSAEIEMPAANVAVAGGHAHVTVGDEPYSALEIFDLADPSAPRSVNGTGIPGNEPWGIAAAGSLLAYTYGNHYWDGGAIHFMDVTSERVVPLLGKLELTGASFFDLTVEGDIGYALTSAWGAGARDFQLLDLSGAPSSITVLASLDLSLHAFDVDAAGDYAYVSGVSDAEFTYIEVIDVSDPHAPQQRGVVGVSGCRSLAVSGSYVYTADYYGLVVVDVSDPDNPAIVADLDLPMQVASLEISGSYVYLAGDHQLEIVDVRSPLHPVQVGGVSLTAYAGGLTVAGSLAHVRQYDSHGPDEVQIIDVADPHAPALRGRFTVPMSSGSMAVSGSFLYMSAGGLLVADVTDPDRPAIVGGAMRYPLSSVTVAKGMVFAGSDDLLMMPVQCEAAGAGESAAIQSAPGLRATPNPARGWTLLRCTVSNAGKARAAIFDLSGRRVRILHDGDWEAGPHNLVWDGKDGRGRPVAAGVYNARVSTSHGSRSARIVMLR